MISTYIFHQRIYIFTWNLDYGGSSTRDHRCATDWRDLQNNNKNNNMVVKAIDDNRSAIAWPHVRGPQRFLCGYHLAQYHELDQCDGDR